MADAPERFTVRPATVEIMSAEEVAAITSRYDELIHSLEAELVVALEEADRAETRLRSHPAAHVIDDDFESFVLWATESQVVEIRRDNDLRNVVEISSPPPVDPQVFDQHAIDQHAVDQQVDVQARLDSSLRTAAPEAPTLLATPVVTSPAAPPTSRSTAGPTPSTREARSGRLTGRTTVVTRPGAAPPPPAPEPAPVEPATAQPAAAQPSDAPSSEKFWDDGRTSRTRGSDRPSRAERDARGHLATLPSTLLMQAGAVIVIVAILVFKLG